MKEKMRTMKSRKENFFSSYQYTHIMHHYDNEHTRKFHYLLVSIQEIDIMKPICILGIHAVEFIIIFYSDMT